jgi:type IV pilus assembly protein PilW
MSARRASSRGMTLIEMMVALLIGTILTVAVFMVMSTFEGRRRTLGSGADLDQDGSIAMFQLDQFIRSSGNGIAQMVSTYSSGAALSYSYGCEIFAQKGGNQLLPVTAAVPLPAPFGNVVESASGIFRLAPVLIIPNGTQPGASTQFTAGATSDVLAVMNAGSTNGQMPSPFTAAPTATALNVTNSVAFAASSPAASPATTQDLVLIADTQSAQPGANPMMSPCMVSQVANTFTAPVTSAGVPNLSLPLGGSGANSWYAATIGSQSITLYTDKGAVVDLGNPSSSNPYPPSFQLVGVGDHNTLYSYDLLNVGATPLQARAEGVFEIHALYVVGTTYFSPSTGSYALSALMTGDAAAAALIKGITGIRVGLIMRTELPEKGPVSPSSLTLFPDLATSLQYTRTLTTDEQRYRYRVIEATIPMRNTF